MLACNFLMLSMLFINGGVSSTYYLSTYRCTYTALIQYQIKKGKNAASNIQICVQVLFSTIMIVNIIKKVFLK